MGRISFAGQCRTRLEWIYRECRLGFLVVVSVRLWVIVVTCYSTKCSKFVVIFHKNPIFRVKNWIFSFFIFSTRILAYFYLWSRGFSPFWKQADSGQNPTSATPSMPVQDFLFFFRGNVYSASELRSALHRWNFTRSFLSLLVCCILFLVRTLQLHSFTKV